MHDPTLARHVVASSCSRQTISLLYANPLWHAQREKEMSSPLIIRMGNEEQGSSIYITNPEVLGTHDPPLPPPHLYFVRVCVFCAICLRWLTLVRG